MLIDVTEEVKLSSATITLVNKNLNLYGAEMYHSVLEKYEYAESNSEDHFDLSPHKITIFRLQKLQQFRKYFSVREYDNH